MRHLALAFIRFYQRHLSPRKGFCCAYRTHTGRQSCSALGYRAVRRFGVIGGVRVLQARTQLCGVAHRRFSPPRRLPPLAQRGVCDVGCDLPCDGSCHLPSCNACNSLGTPLECACRLADCGSSSCGDWPSRKDAREREAEAGIYLPPQRNPGRR